jgi:hypothetical protein
MRIYKCHGAKVKKYHLQDDDKTRAILRDVLFIAPGAEKPCRFNPRCIVGKFWLYSPQNSKNEFRQIKNVFLSELLRNIEIILIANQY